MGVYEINGEIVEYDERYIVASIMAVIVAMRELNPDKPEVAYAIEQLTEVIYEQIKETKPADTERPTDKPAL